MGNGSGINDCIRLIPKRNDKAIVDSLLAVDDSGQCLRASAVINLHAYVAIINKHAVRL